MENDSPYLLIKVTMTKNRMLRNFYKNKIAEWVIPGPGPSTA